MPPSIRRGHAVATRLLVLSVADMGTLLVLHAEFATNQDCACDSSLLYNWLMARYQLRIIIIIINHQHAQKAELYRKHVLFPNVRLQLSSFCEHLQLLLAGQRLWCREEIENWFCARKWTQVLTVGLLYTLFVHLCIKIILFYTSNPTFRDC